MTQIKTLSPMNQFRFACPVFGAEVEMRGCVKLREAVTRGARPEQRRGCQACMRASKCPIVRMYQQISRTGEDHYHASESRVGHLRPELLANIAPILVNEVLLDEYGVPPSEREMILAANEKAGVPKGKAPARSRTLASVALDDLPAETRKPAPALADADLSAAMAGDMSAAISKAANAPESPVSAPEPVVAQSQVKAAPTPPRANVAKATPSEIAKSPPATAPAAKRPSLLELARMRKAS